MAKTVEQMTAAELEERIETYMGKRAEITAELRRMQQRRTELVAAEQAAATVSGLTPAQRVALAQELQTAGIASEEEFGEV